MDTKREIIIIFSLTLAPQRDSERVEMVIGIGGIDFQ